MALRECGLPRYGNGKGTTVKAVDRRLVAMIEDIYVDVNVIYGYSGHLSPSSLSLRVQHLPAAAVTAISLRVN